jgi:predicted nuclease of predicted toxin-antitoxin system
MKGFLFDEHIPSKIQFSPQFPVIHVSVMGKSPSDTQIWEYAKQHDLAIVTKDVDFSDRIIISNPPPRVVHLRFGNMRKNDFHAFLAKVWPQIEKLITDHRLVNVYRDRIETVV